MSAIPFARVTVHERFGKALHDRGLQALREFVDDEKARAGGERAGQRKLLLLPARERAGRLVEPRLHVWEQSEDVELGPGVGRVAGEPDVLARW